MTCSPYDNNVSARGSSDTQCPKDWQVVKVDGGIVGSVLVTVVDDKLAEIEVNDGQVARLLFKDHYNTPIQQVVYAHRESADTFSVMFREGDVAKAGLFLADISLYQFVVGSSTNVDSSLNLYVPVPDYTVDLSQNRPIWVQRLFLEITPNNILDGCQYPLSIAEVRLAIRDICAQANFLIDDLEYTDKEIMYAIASTVDYWNEVPPDVIRFTYSSFPFRYHWKLGVIGKLMMQAALHKLRNWLPYQGGNVSVNDTSTWQNYHQMGTQYWEDYKAFVVAKKVEYNINNGFRGHSGYTTGW